ncbi:unnamed protein product [Lactuca saligna]|uniref:C2H2-type domain-containing protein n=1 Tax=Lactuca saligna TaxID=75948 RepID=A0AA35Y8G7_LACSI|nr:unnamed protein product [Lactuca saligna]
MLMVAAERRSIANILLVLSPVWAIEAQRKKHHVDGSPFSSVSYAPSAASRSKAAADKSITTTEHPEAQLKLKSFIGMSKTVVFLISFDTLRVHAKCSMKCMLGLSFEDSHERGLHTKQKSCSGLEGICNAKNSPPKGIML